MNTVKIYKINCTESVYAFEAGEHYALVPWGKSTDVIKGSDDGGRDYILPDGYEVAMSQAEELRIFDPRGEGAKLIAYNSMPALVTSRLVNPLPLKRA